MTTEVGEAAKTEIRSISFDDEEALAKLNEVIAKLEELQQTYPGAEIYLNGELTVLQIRNFRYRSYFIIGRV